MKVLITGATGLVGKTLVELCLKEGYSINYLTTSKNKIVNQPNYRGFFWNPSAGEIDENALLEVNVIIHLAGASIAQRWTNASKQVILDSRIKSAELLYDVVARFRAASAGRQESNKNSITHIISASAIGCYPTSPTKFYDENYPSYATGFLGEVVEQWENAVLKFKQLDIQTALVRTGIILDAREGALPKIIQPIKMYAGAPLGNGEQWQSWIHIDDMAAMYMHILQKKLEGIYNGVAPNPVTNKKLTKLIAQVLKKPLLLPNVPAFALKRLLGEMATIVLESQKVSSQKIEQTGFSFTYTSVENAIQNLLIPLQYRNG